MHVENVKEYEGSLEGDENILKSDHGNDCTTFYTDENQWIIYFKGQILWHMNYISKNILNST